MPEGVPIEWVAQKGLFDLVNDRVLEVGVLLKRYRRWRIISPRFRHCYSPDKSEKYEQ